MSIICIIDGGNLRNFPYPLDYQKLYEYVTDVLGAKKSQVFYLGAIPTSYYFKMYDWLGNECIDLEIFKSWVDEQKEICESILRFKEFISEQSNTIRLFNKNDIESEREKALTEIESVNKQLNFMLNLKKIGYQLELTPLKHYISSGNQLKKKGDSDIRIAMKIFDLLPNMEKLIFISGDGDFISLLKKIKREGKDVVIMGYKTNDRITNRTAKEVVAFAGGKFLNFASSDLKEKFEYHKKEK